MQNDADFITADFLYMFRPSCAHHQEYKILTRNDSFVPNMAKWGSTCNHIYLYRWLPCLYFILLMMGAWRPKHVEKFCNNKICILLHHVGVLFNLIVCFLRSEYGRNRPVLLEHHRQRSKSETLRSIFCWHALSIRVIRTIHINWVYIRIGFNYASSNLVGVRGGAVGWGTALHAGRSRVGFSMVSLKFFIGINLPIAFWPWGRLSL